MAIQTTDGRLAIEQALKPLESREGARIGVLGDSGCGKTQIMQHIVATYLKRKKDAIALVVDDKGKKAAFKGQERRDVAELQSRPLDPKGPRIVVFRGDRFDRQTGEVDPETVAQLQWKLSQLPRPTIGVYDELDKACNHAQWRDNDSSVRWGFSKGRDVEMSMLWGTQETQAVPAEAFNQSSNIFAFRMMGAPLRLLKQRGYLEGGAEKVIEHLPGDELPREQRGYFVLLRRGRPWDGKVYRYR